MCPQGRHSYRVFSVFWPVMEATVYNWRPHVFQLPLPIAYIKLEWLLVADTLPASEFGKYEVMSLLRAEQGGGGGGNPLPPVGPNNPNQNYKHHRIHLPNAHHFEI